MPELPEPPIRVCAVVDKGKSWAFIAWWFYRRGVNRFSLLSGAYKRIAPDRLEVIPHPANDAAAVEIVQRAKEGK